MIKGGCQFGRKVVPHDSESDLPLATEQEKVLFPHDFFGTSLILQRFQTLSGVFFCNTKTIWYMEK